MPDTADIAIIGAGAAGLMAAVWAGRERDGRGTIVALDGARTLGAKILVAGGGRCNVTHDVVDESAFAGSSRHAIKKVLRRFDVTRTVDFFRELGVQLKREETGKLFPTTDRARTVLDALLGAADAAGCQIRHPWRVESVTREGEWFVIRRAVPPVTDDEPGPGDQGPGPHSPARPSSDAAQPHNHVTEAEAQVIRARRLILATGGKALPRTGSDGHGYTIARSLGHTITERVFPALVPLTLPRDHFICALSGLTVPATVEVRSATGKRLVSFTDSTLCTHFGLSGPSVLDVSRHYSDARASDPGTRLVINWLPGMALDSLDAALRDLKSISPARLLTSPPHSLPDRLARALCAYAGVDPSAPGHQLTRDKRRALASAVTELPLPITGDRGFTHAEVTAGGIPLGEIRLETMESRVCPGLHLCGEICDVDGRIGGYNFQWAWASGFVAGTACGAAQPRP